MAKLEVTFRGLCAFVTDTRDPHPPTQVTVVLIDGEGAGHCPHQATLTFNAVDFDKEGSDIRDLDVEQAPGGQLVAMWPIEKRELSITSSGGDELQLDRFDLIDEETVKKGVAHESCKPKQLPERPVAARFVINRGLVYCLDSDDKVPKRNKVEIVRYRVETVGNEVAIAATNLMGTVKHGTLRLKPKSGDTVRLAVSDLPSVRNLGKEHNTAYQRLLRDKQDPPQFSGGACIPRRMFEIDP